MASTPRSASCVPIHFAGAFYHTIGYVQKADEKDILRITEAEMKKAGESPASPEGKARMASIKRLYKHPAMRVGKTGVEAFAENAAQGRARQAARAGQRLGPRDRPICPAMTSRACLAPTSCCRSTPNCRTTRSRRFGNEAGSAVVIDVATGEVVCMMSTPGAGSQSVRLRHRDRRRTRNCKDDIRNPLYHKAYEGVYPPGSTFKIVVAAAAWSPAR